MGKTSIQWTEHSINPIRANRRDGSNRIPGHYCEKVSAGCRECYASTMQRRFGTPGFGSGQHREQVSVFLDDSKLEEVLRRRKPTTYFWCDMTDMFGDWVPFEWIDRCFAVMALSPQHTHQVLTKRPERMADYLNWNGVISSALPPRDWVDRLTLADERCRLLGGDWPLKNVWLGTSLEDQSTADDRIPHLLECPAAVRFLSCEPLLGMVDLRPGAWSGCLTCYPKMCRCRVPSGIDWVIVGGESGPNARPCHLDWIRAVVQQCESARTACFVKQCGTRPVGLQLKDRKGGDPDEWPEDLRVRQMPEPVTAN